MPSGGNSTQDSSDLSFSYTSYPFSFSVQRKSTGDTIFNSSGSNLIFESQYVRLRTQLPDDPYIYGLGEDSDRFRRETKNYTRTLWNMGNPGLQNHENLYGSHPFYLEMRNGQAHGVFLWNSNGMDIKIDQDTNGQYLEYNINGGVLDFYFVSGPQPADVSRQYANIIGTVCSVRFHLEKVIV
jgi:alpha-glucosidase